MMGKWKQKLEAKHGPMRPIWQILVLLPLWPLYLIARAFVEWMDDDPFPFPKDQP